MAHPQSGETRFSALRFAAFLVAVFLISLGLSDLFTRSFASTGEEEDPDYPELYDDTARYLRMHYLDQDRVSPRGRQLVEKALSTLENMVDEVYVENSNPDDPFVEVHVGTKVKVYSMAKITNLEEAIATLKDLTLFIKANYHGKRNLNEIRYFILNGFLGGLDPHTQVFNPRGFKDFSVHIEGEIFGVGMYVGAMKGVLTVKKVLKDTPAERAGFKRNDRILKIGEESTVNMDVNEAVKKIRGPEHSKIVLTVRRKEKDGYVTLPIEVQRERVTIPSVIGKLLPEPKDDAGKPALAYVQVNNFDKNTVPSLKESLESIRESNGGKEIDGLILDLRENSGGLLQQASDMADLFLSKGELYWIAQRGKEEEKGARSGRSKPRYPILVLGNERSASGAEIVIGALQKNGRAVVLGTPTFGKGSVQQLHPLRHEWQLKITVSEYLIPGKISIQENGVIPDIQADRAVVSDKLLNIFPNRRFGTEKDYGDHIVSRYCRKEEPAERIQYLAEVVDPDVEDPEEAAEALVGEVDPEKDTLVQIAAKLLRPAIKEGAGGATFDSAEYLKKHTADIDRIRGEQFAEIARKLKDRGIDWSDGPNPETAQVELTVEYSRMERPSTDKDDPVPKPFLLLKARATNRSREIIHRLKGITDSDYFLYREHEFLFGKLEPDATLERTVEVPIPYYPYARSDAVKVVLSGPSGKPYLEKEFDAVLEEAARPGFAYAATLMDKDKQAPITALAPGQEAVFKLTLFNTGRAEAHKGVAILKNTTGPEVFLDPPGRIELLDLGACEGPPPGSDGTTVEPAPAGDGAKAPPGRRDVEFAFRITPDSKAKKYTFELAMVDSYSGEALSREVEIPAEGGDGAPFPNGRLCRPPQIAAFIAEPIAGTAGKSGGTGASGAAAEPAQAPANLLVTDRAEVELTARVTASQTPFNAWVTDSPVSRHEEDPDKIFFAESRGTEPLKFTTVVPLKKGTNIIHVIAADENGLQGRETLVIRRK